MKILITLILILSGLLTFNTIEKNNVSEKQKNLGATITAAFPTSYNYFTEDDYVEDEDIDAIEATIGITNATNTDSHDYMIRNHTFDTWKMLTVNAVSPTSTIGFIVNASSTLTGDFRVQGNSTTTGSFFATGIIDSNGGFIGNLTGNADTATALAANPADCLDGFFALGIGANGSSTCASAGSVSTSNWQFITPNGIKPTSTVGIIINASSTFSAATTTFGMPPVIDRDQTANATSSDFYSLITVGHALNPFGNYYEPRGWETNFGPATSTGFIVSSATCVNDSAGCYIRVQLFISSTTPATASSISIRDTSFSTNANTAASAASFGIVPIGHYWYASSSVNGGSNLVDKFLWWVPMK